MLLCEPLKQTLKFCQALSQFRDIVLHTIQAGENQAS